jgi:hypothetical protein
MKKALLSVAMLCLGTLAAQAQYRKPTVDQSQELVGLRTCFVISDTFENRALLVKELNKQYPQVQVVDWAADAEFFLESRVYDDGVPDDFKTTELVAYVKQSGRKIIVWTEWEADDGTTRTNEQNLVRHLVKAIAKASGSK